MNTERHLFATLDDDNLAQGAMSEDGAPDKGVGSEDDFSDKDKSLGVLKFERIETNNLQLETQFGPPEEEFTIESYCESVKQMETPKPLYMESKRRANCCSRLTFWYANPLIESVRANNGQMHKKMIEDMHSDPDRSEKLLKFFQERLRANAKQW